MLMPKGTFPLILEGLSTSVYFSVQSALYKVPLNTS